MTRLRIHADDDPLRYDELLDGEAIAEAAARAGFRFERWPLGDGLSTDATESEVLAAYAGAIARLKRECGFVTADVVAVSPGTPDHAILRGKFLDEHTHAEDEARFFVQGSGLFCLHLGASVYSLLCEAGDLVNVPAGTRHWFDMGPAPSFRCIRVFRDPKGWVAQATGSDIAARFPRLGEEP